MKRDYLEIGPTPTEEDCIPAGQNPVEERRECQRFINLLREMFGEERGTARLIIRSNPHDLATYLEVAVSYQVEDEIGFDYALAIENYTPRFWDKTKEFQDDGENSMFNKEGNFDWDKWREEHPIECGEISPTGHTLSDVI